MKKILLLAILLPTIVLTTLTSSWAKPAAGVIHDFKVMAVKDGDTVVIEAPYLPAPLKPLLSIRILGVDTPEKAPRAKCDKEAAGGAAATEFTKKAVANAKQIQVELVDWDKFGGRVLGDVILDGQRLSQMLIKNNLARPYFGEAKASWCN
jgi:endonuclease YncB( thermonuclease family)